MFEIYTSESVTDGHPDKLADQISDAIVDRVLTDNPDGTAAVDTFLCGNTIILTGAIAGGLTFEPYDLVRDVIASAGYIGPACAVDYRSFNVVPRICARENDVIRYSELSPGGTIYGYACSETPELMPIPTTEAHRLARYLSEEGQNAIPHMRPECSAQISVVYIDNVPHRIQSVFVSAHYYEGIAKDLFAWEVKDYVKNALSSKLVDDDTEIVVKAYGEFDTGPKSAKVGFTGRRLDVDTYGGFTRNVGAVFSGRTPGFGDRAAACMARYIAKNIVAADLAKRCEVALPYIQGNDEPLRPIVNTFGDGRHHDENLSRLAETHFDLSPQGIVCTLNMNRPIYRNLAVYGCFGRNDLDVRWESTDAAEMLRCDKAHVGIPARSITQWPSEEGEDD